MEHRSHGQMSEAFLTAALLTASGGLQDAYTYISRGKVFANAQTGNIVLLSQSVCIGDWALAFQYLVPLLAFALGIGAAEGVRQSYQNARRIHWRQLIVLGEMLLLLFVGFLPDTWNLPANAIVSFCCAMQVQAFRKVNGYVFASTMCIGNIRSGMEAFLAYRRTRSRKALQKAAHYFSLILLFAVGAGIGGRLIPVLGLRTIWASCALLCVSFCLMLKN